MKTFSIIPFHTTVANISTEAIKKVHEILLNTGLFEESEMSFDGSEIDVTLPDEDETDFREFCNSVRYFIGGDLSAKVVILTRL